eukprot:CAMPEP_0174234552 /NCGR_PEP_ID=MMETSP0417-20130205/4279_1 /TAXON_ID=242541 /ORGANISM="Mayorella sp, Strain BSH-02190019" /LENGTH=205 /DNA_ID=CAMNT_0015312929 /DNA_START=277 /DNA_END=894 /DNA_ORIENTATION=-
MLRAITHALASRFFGPRLVVVDTSGEIAGAGDMPHPCVLPARTMTVPRRPEQARVMLEAVQNHSPRVLVIDEMGTRQEVDAACDIRTKGVSLVATTHGDTLKEVLDNPRLANMLGKPREVVLSAKETEEARLRANQSVELDDRKTRLQRTQEPIFDMVVELRSFKEVVVYREVGRAIDRLLRGQDAPYVHYECDEDDTIHAEEVL